MANRNSKLDMSDFCFSYPYPFWFVITLAAFCGYFFGVNYPEVLRTRYIPADLVVRTAALQQRYCCGLSCTCDTANSSLAPCGFMVQQTEAAFSPTKCAAATTNASSSESCPSATIQCNGGSFCCDICCHGECKCCQNVEQARCSVVCKVCYSVDLATEFEDRRGKRHTVLLSEDFGRSQDGAEGYLAANQPDARATTPAFYKPSDPSVVLFSRRLTPWKWGVLVVFAFPLQITSYLLTQALVTWHIRKWSLSWPDGGADANANTRPSTERPVRRQQNNVARDEEVVCMSNVALWMGLLWPLAILLPILVVGYVSPHWHTALVVLIPSIAAFGWFSPVLRRLEHMGWSPGSSFFIAVCFGLLPLCVLLPILILIPKTLLPMSIVMGVLLLALALASCGIGPPQTY